MWVNSTSAVDGMKFVVRNNSTNGKKTKIDHIYAEVFLSSGADTTPPETSITSGPGEGSLTNVDSASLGFSSSEGGSSFECDLDAGGWGPCISPESYVGLADGSHTFMVRATDAATNTDPSPASRTWTVDTAAPAAPLINAPVEDALLASSTVLVSARRRPTPRWRSSRALPRWGPRRLQGWGPGRCRWSLVTVPMR